MSERFDDAVKRRYGADTAVICDVVEQDVAGDHEPCRAEFQAALAACEQFDKTDHSEADWLALERALTALQECTEDPSRNP